VTSGHVSNASDPDIFPDLDQRQDPYLKSKDISYHILAVLVPNVT